MNGTKKHQPEANDLAVKLRGGRRALQQRRRCTVRYAGVVAREHVGMSNDNADEKSAHHKPEVS
jgi:hypothetical protein